MDEKLNAALKGIYDSLTDEQKEKARTCKTLDELTVLAGKEGVELPDEVLDQVAGGCGDSSPEYPKHSVDWSCEHQQDYMWDPMWTGDCAQCIYAEEYWEHVYCHYPDRVR